MTKFEIPNDWFLILFEIWILSFGIYLYFGACILEFGIILGGGLSLKSET